MSVSRLVSELRPRIGRFVPRETHPEWMGRQGYAFNHRGVRAEVIDKEDSRGRREAKEYMRRVFYKEAPIPMALGLAEGPKQVQDFLEEEMDTHLDSGGCLQFREEEGGKRLLGVGFFCLWAKREEYVVLEGDATSWHNAAAVLAKEREAQIDPRVTWRDLQYQHIYNLSQRVLRRYPKKKGMVWAAMLSFVKEARERGLSEHLMSSSIHMSDESEVILGAQSNFPGFDKFVFKQFRNPLLVDQAKYAHEELEVDGVKVLQSLAHLDGMKFFINAPSTR